ncbi:MAG TPA: hypothetical protein VG711_05740 [Phycisphaerales bacterium]|nr:hypothetical protein [Phycisphaerales bacterium]
MPSAALPARSRVILLGASNLAIGLPHVLSAARSIIAGPMDVFAAVGRGRSLGTWSSVFGRSIPGMLQSRLWELLVADRAHQFAGETFALLTDVGNDILYNVPPVQIIEWTSELIRRLHSLNAKIILALPPIDRINRLNPATFLLVRTLIYPRRNINFKTAISHANQIFNELQKLADREHVHTVIPSPDWYGIDPVHIRRSLRARAWQNILASWQKSSADSPSANHMLHSFTRLERLRMKFRMPMHWRLFGINIQNQRPHSYSFAGDSTLRLF